jgi:hypothetical protein
MLRLCGFRYHQSTLVLLHTTLFVQDYKATQKVAAEREAQYMPKVPPAAAARPGMGGSSGKAAAAAAAAAAGGSSEADMEAQALLQVSCATVCVAIND